MKLKYCLVIICVVVVLAASVIAFAQAPPANASQTPDDSAGGSSLAVRVQKLETLTKRQTEVINGLADEVKKLGKEMDELKKNIK